MPDQSSPLQSRYQILRPLARGGMGTLYEAIDLRFQNRVAVKQSICSDRTFTSAFEREARLLRSLKHDGLPRVIDYFSEGDDLYIVMDFVDGKNLEEMLAARRRPFEMADALRWTDELLDVLSYLHSQATPIIHRDVKPANIKVTESGRLILLDFGLSKGRTVSMAAFTGAESVRGYTPNFASPEQIEGLPTDARSDVYSVAATLFYLVTAQVPPSVLDRAGAAVMGRPDPLPMASLLNPTVPVEIAELLMQSMSRDRNDRPADASGMRKALRKCRSVALNPLEDDNAGSANDFRDCNAQTRIVGSDTSESTTLNITTSKRIDDGTP